MYDVGRTVRKRACAITRRKRTSISLFWGACRGVRSFGLKPYALCLSKISSTSIRSYCKLILTLNQIPTPWCFRRPAPQLFRQIPTWAKRAKIFRAPSVRPGAVCAALGHTGIRPGRNLSALGSPTKWRRPQSSDGGFVLRTSATPDAYSACVAGSAFRHRIGLRRERVVRNNPKSLNMKLKLRSSCIRRSCSPLA